MTREKMLPALPDRVLLRVTLCPSVGRAFGGGRQWRGWIGHEPLVLADGDVGFLTGGAFWEIDEAVGLEITIRRGESRPRAAGRFPLRERRLRSVDPFFPRLRPPSFRAVPGPGGTSWIRGPAQRAETDGRGAVAQTARLGVPLLWFGLAPISVLFGEEQRCCERNDSGMRRTSFAAWRRRRNMGERTEIGWTDSTFNPWRGCTKVSRGCLNCYAERQATRSPGVLGGDEVSPHGVTAVTAPGVVTGRRA